MSKSRATGLILPDGTGEHVKLGGSSESLGARDIPWDLSQTPPPPETP